jgi:hypothetical protein
VARLTGQWRPRSRLDAAAPTSAGNARQRDQRSYFQTLIACWNDIAWQQVSAIGGPRSWSMRTAVADGQVTQQPGQDLFNHLQHGQVAPDWPTGIALGVGGLAGAYTGARIQSRLPDALIRRLIGILVIAIGARYLWSGLG